MASIKIDSKIVVEACIRAMKKNYEYSIELSLNRHFLKNINEEEFNNQKEKANIDKIINIAKYSIGHSMYIDHNDFQLIGEYL